MIDNKAINKYVNAYVDALTHGDVPAPSAGDCWFCLMQTTDGQNLGELVGDNHIISHIEEPYFVPSLLVNAIKYQDGLSPMAHYWLTCLWSQSEDLSEFPESWQGLFKRQFKTTLRRYIKKQLRDITQWPAEAREI